MASVAVAHRVVEGTAQSVAHGRLGNDLLVSKSNKEFIQTRLNFFQALYEKQQQELAGRPREVIEIVLPDGTVKNGLSFEITPRAIALQISKEFADQVVVARVTSSAGDSHCNLVSADNDDDEEPCCSSNFELWDLNRPFEGNCKVEFLKFDSTEGMHVFWHSSSHVLGQALEEEFGAYLTVGPALERGFYYDCFMGSTSVVPECYVGLESRAQEIIRENQQFERLVLSKENALILFKDNPFKVSLIKNKVPDGAMTTCYRCGPLIDLCRGPHLPSTGKIKAFSIEKHSSAYWLGSAENGRIENKSVIPSDGLQRVYGISFPDTKLMKKYKQMLEEAKKRDHRVVGSSMNLFFFETLLSPGSCFWLPDGTKIYNKLIEFIKSEYRIRGFTEVISPNIFSCDLFKVSGHYQNYKENMYCFDVEGKEWALKPMNCPGHCLIFRHMKPSYRQLPIRMADFGILHRNELSGSLTGLIRVRRFAQDDAHIFCRMDQVKDEVLQSLEFLFFIYGVFGFNFEMQLSTRPKKALGDLELWNNAEEALAEAMNLSGKTWKVNPGDGAFYGPKIDIRLQDALQRWHQCGTVQLDFQLPLRFNLQYKTDEMGVKSDVEEPSDVNELVAEDFKKSDGSWETKLRIGFARPVMVHRAILGSIERMAAVLLEHTAGKFPFWLSPRQICVCPISEKNHKYAKYVATILKARGFEASVDESNTTINKKIRQVQMEKWNYALVVGQQEQDNLTVTVRNRDDPNNQQQKSLAELIEILDKLKMPSSRSEVLPPFDPTD